MCKNLYLKGFSLLIFQNFRRCTIWRDWNQLLWIPKYLIVTCVKNFVWKVLCVDFSKVSPMALVEGTEMSLWIPKCLVVACVKTLSEWFFSVDFSKCFPVALVEGTEKSLWIPKCLVVVCVKNVFLPWMYPGTIPLKYTAPNNSSTPLIYFT